MWSRVRFRWKNPESAVEISRFPCHDFLQKFREINSFTKELYCKLIWQKKFCVAVNSSFFHTVESKRTSLLLTKISWK